MCKSHPEDLLRGQRHPLAAIAPTSLQPFEVHIIWADRFLFDFGQSTTFAEAICTGFERVDFSAFRALRIGAPA